MSAPVKIVRQTPPPGPAVDISGQAVLAGWSAALALPWLVPPQGAPSPTVIPWIVTLACLAFVLITRGLIDTSALSANRTLILAWQASLVAGALANSLCGLVQLMGWWTDAQLLIIASDGQVIGMLRQRNQLASLIVMGLCVLLWWRPGTRLQEFVASVSAVLLGMTLAATASRTGVLALTLALLLFTYFRLKARADGLYSCVPSAVIISSYLSTTILLYLDAGKHFAGSGLLARAHEDNASCVGRMHIWSNVVELIGQRPWTGWGWGELAYAHVMADYGGERSCEMVDNAHNLPLHLAVTLGLPLALLLLLTAALRVWRAAPWKEVDPSRQLAWTLISVLGLHSLLEYPLWYGPFMLTACLAVWRLWGAGLTHPSDARAVADGDRAAGPNRKLGHAGRSLPGALLLAVASYAAWDYHRVGQLYLPPEERSAAYREHTLEKTQSSVLFRRQVEFAALQITPLTPATAEPLYEMALRAMHYSPEPGVIRKLIACARLSGKSSEAQAWSLRLNTAYPEDR